jgi:hypothetical protein
MHSSSSRRKTSPSSPNDDQLVDFLYKLGSDASMVRVIDLELQPDGAHQHLNANIRLVASYQKNPTRKFENHNRKRQMKTTTLILILFLTGLDLWAQMPPALRQLPQRFSPATNAAVVPPTIPAPPTVSSPDTNAPGVSAGSNSEQMIPPGTINFEGVDVDQVLDVYAQLVGRTILRAGLPQAQIVLKTETPLTKSEAIEALQAVLALNNIAVINVGDKFVKVLQADQANSAGAPIDHSSEKQLPELGQYVTHIVQLKYVKPSEMVPVIQPFAKLQNSILPIDSNGILVLRDNAENVKLMLEMIDQVDVAVPAEFISEVIPIKYAMVDDIANALNSLGGSSSSIGSATTTPGSTANRPSGTTTGAPGVNGQVGGYNQNQPRTLGAAAGGATGNTFSQRLQQIIQRAATGGSGEIQILGQTKIIADERSNSLLVYATREDMATIKDIVKKLDVLLSQVLIESVIMDVSLNKGWNFGVSAVQNPQTYSPSVPIVGAGGNNNGQPFLSFLQNVVTNSTSSTSKRQKHHHQQYNHLHNLFHRRHQLQFFLCQFNSQRLQLLRQHRSDLGSGAAGGGIGHQRHHHSTSAHSDFAGEGSAVFRRQHRALCDERLLQQRHRRRAEFVL